MLSGRNGVANQLLLSRVDIAKPSERLNAYLALSPPSPQVPRVPALQVNEPGDALAVHNHLRDAEAQRPVLDDRVALDADRSSTAGPLHQGVVARQIHAVPIHVL